MNPKKRSGMSGQLSLFALLIFQVLFVLFAMSLNVALVVHDKINLQNSADLAAYYGAMKQAQMLNAIAHINYQIRQSWKLLAWRTKVLGTIANISPPPLEKDQLYTPQNLRQGNTRLQEGAFISCISHSWWHHPGFQNTNDRLCQDINDDQIPNVDVSDVQSLSGVVPFNVSGLLRVTRRSRRRALHNCDNYGDKTWLFSAAAFIHWMRDQSHRKLMIYHLARHLQENKDLEGGDINTGVQTTFEKNLSFMNRKHFQSTPGSLQPFSSLKTREPREWLEDQPFFTDLLYAFAGGTDDHCVKTVRLLSQDSHPAAEAGMKEALQKAFAALNQFEQTLCEDSGDGERFCPGSAGMVKKKEFMVYFGVKAQLDYKAQIFLPTGSNITLKAEAYAKPFGGRMGPLNPPQHLSQNRFDKLLPVQLTSSIDLPHQAREKLIEYDKLFTPNYSRYPGDPLGLRSHIVHYRWISFLKNQAQQTKTLDFFDFSDANDPLAFDMRQPDQTPAARYWELAAVAPDLFDTTYFTILPSYSEDYFNKVKKILENRGRGHLVRGDFGWREGRAISPERPLPSLIDYQINQTWQSFQNLPHPLKKPFYKLKKLEHLLTGFNPPKRKYQSSTHSYAEAQTSHTNFGTCQVWDKEVARDRPERRIANACVSGGRTGYSVKMVSRDFIDKIDFDGQPPTSPVPSWW